MDARDAAVFNSRQSELRGADARGAAVVNSRRRELQTSAAWRVARGAWRAAIVNSLWRELRASAAYFNNAILRVCENSPATSW